MLHFPKFGLAATVVLSLCAFPWTLTGQEIKSSRQGTLNLSPPGVAVCPARSVNYITDTLPQQCLATRRIEVIRIAVLATEKTDTNPREATSTLSDDGIIVGVSSPSVQVAINLPSASGADATVHNTNTVTRLIGAHPNSSTTGASLQTGTTAKVEPDGDSDSPLDNANFLSFEEWKKQNLEKAGQSLDNIAGRKEIGDRSPRGRPPTINNALDSLGEDNEIEIDFGGFVNPGSTPHAVPPIGAGAHNDPAERLRPIEAKAGKDLSSSHRRSKDAGKTCKERFNYASFDCAATVLKTNKECKGSTSVLIENKDSYMLNICSADNKFFIVELCGDILVDTVVLANFEFFSSMFRTFRVSVSDQYPVKLEKWRELGTFEARNSREVQAFLVESPLIWARYLRVEFLAHYGNEYYCPVSLLRVHGTTMMEEFNHDMKGLRGEDEADSEVGEEAEEEVGLASDSGVILADALKEESKSLVAAVETTVIPEVPQPADTLVSLNESDASNSSKMESLPTEISIFEPLLERQLKAIIQSLTNGEATCALDEWKSGLPSSVSPVEGNSHSGRSPDSAQPPSSSAQDEISLRNEQPSAQTMPSSVESVTSLSASETENIRDVMSATKTIASNSQLGVKPHTSTQPPAANPTTQESFFKTVHKRLQLLEANSTLSLQYIEEQSRILRDAFTKVEKRQLHKMTTFLESLNATVLTEVRNLQAQYDQLWQSTVLELSAQREVSHNEVVALSARLSLLADEMYFQKRIAILQSMLILLCLGLVIFTRASISSSSTPHPTPHDAASYAEFPSVLQNVSNKSTANLSRYNHLETPTTSPPSTRPSSRYGIFGRGQEITRSPSEESGTGVGGGTSIGTSGNGIVTANGGLRIVNGTADGN